MAIRISVIGAGYLGVTHAACMAESGFEVVALDVDHRRVEALARGEVPFHEPGLDELVARHVAEGRLQFTTSWADVGAFADVHFLCVGTPQRPDGRGADLRFLEDAVDALAPHLEQKCLVVGKSTVPVGSAARLAGRLSSRAPVGFDAELAWNPEFLREGTAVENTLRPDRIIVGVRSEFAEKVLREVYARHLDQGAPLLVTDVSTAELVKVAANAFLATKLSFINLMAQLCEATGADVVALQDALGKDERIGRLYLQAGLGFGGGCLPKDIRALMVQAEELGVGRAATFLREVEAVNAERRAHVVALAEEACGGSVQGRRVAVLGASFKPGSDDVRDSPALSVAAELARHGAEVSVFDPVASENARRVHPALRYPSSVLEAAEGAHVLMHLTEWAEFQQLEPSSLNHVVASRYVIDGRNALDPDRWRSEGWIYRGLGQA
ncbi:MAG TPA: UDP-glucose/GDP-mannose dehydrogenase family protein [Marmoricola sp.]|nr:UDP-glucose/GDP-mannose dehydrogenase family protein [Marmoricola sp.]